MTRPTPTIAPASWPASAARAVQDAYERMAALAAKEEAREARDARDLLAAAAAAFGPELGAFARLEAPAAEKPQNPRLVGLFLPEAVPVFCWFSGSCGVWVQIPYHPAGAGKPPAECHLWWVEVEQDGIAYAGLDTLGEALLTARLEWITQHEKGSDDAHANN